MLVRYSIHTGPSFYDRLGMVVNPLKKHGFAILGYAVVIILSGFFLMFVVSGCLYFNHRYLEELDIREGDKNFYNAMCTDVQKQVSHGATAECKERSHRLREAFWLHPMDDTLNKFGIGHLICGEGGCVGILKPLILLISLAFGFFALNVMIFSRWKKETIRREINPAREGGSII